MKDTDTPVSHPVLVIVGGLPATGKTNLAQRIAAHFVLPLMIKDCIKEVLCDVLGCADLPQSQKVGQASMLLLYQFAEAVLATQQSCVIESPFHPEFSTSDLLKLQQRCPFTPLQIHCRTDNAVLIERWRQRIASGERHPGHMDSLRGFDVNITHMQEHSHPLALDGLVIELDTTSFESIDYAALFAQMEHMLHQAASVWRTAPLRRSSPCSGF
ncbi:MAG: AAA family ATPase [Ktedonobacteraceae bacterium]